MVTLVLITLHNLVINISDTPRRTPQFIIMPLVEIIVPSIPSNVPAFLAKLWKMVENHDTGEDEGEGEGREAGRVRFVGAGCVTAFMILN